MNPRAKKRVFLGYSHGVKGYKVWLLDKKKCVISMDVLFNEWVFYNTNKSELDETSSNQTESKN